MAVTMTVGADCRLRGGSAELLAELKRQLTIANPKHQDALKYGRWIGKKLKPELYFFEIEDGAIRFPRGFAGAAVHLCQRLTGRMPEIEDQRRLLPPLDLPFGGRLRPYQEAAIRDVLRKHFGVLVAPTGSGKTVMAMALIAARSQPTLILLHNKELLYQWRERLAEFMGLEAGLIGDGHHEVGPVTIGIVNSVRNRLAELAPLFGHLVVDECHRVPASLFTGVVREFDCQYMLGLSATAYRREDGLTKLINYFMGERVHQVNLQELEAAGAVLKPSYIQHQTDFLHTFKGDYQELLSALTRNEPRNRRIAADIAAEARQARGTILVVSDRVAHCEQLAALLAEHGIEPAILTGRLPAEARSRVVEEVRQGRVKVLIATLQLVGEGFDVTGLTTLFLTTPIKFSGRLRQVIGRILRPAEGKQPKVVDYADQHIGVLRKSAQARLRTYE